MKAKNDKKSTYPTTRVHKDFCVTRILEMFLSSICTRSAVSVVVVVDLLVFGGSDRSTRFVKCCKKCATIKYFIQPFFFCTL